MEHDGTYVYMYIQKGGVLLHCETYTSNNLIPSKAYELPKEHENPFHDNSNYATTVEI